jgi:hypothetical protein
MRRPIRPFVTEYKSRSPKSSPREAEPADIEPRPRFLEPPAPAPRARDDGHHDDSYEAAMRAADLIFGKKTAPPPAAPVRKAEGHAALAEALFTSAPVIDEPPPAPPVAPLEAAPPPPSAGRILPSLIEADLAQPRRDEEVERPARKRGRPRKTPLEPQKTEASAADPSDEAAQPVAPIRRAPPATRRRAEHPAAAEPTFLLDDAEEDDEEVVAMPEDAEEEPEATRRSRRPIQARWVRRTELAAGEKWKRRLPDSLRSR